jgi:hypothetical protein
MSSKRQTTQYNHWQRAKSALSDLYMSAKIYRLTHAQILERRSKLFESNSYRRLTTYYVGYMRGLDDAYMADIWRNHVVWMLGPKSGPTRQVHTEWTEEMSTLCRTPGALFGGHYWTDDSGKPTDKVFTEYACTNAAKEETNADDNKAL